MTLGGRRGGGETERQTDKLNLSASCQTDTKRLCEIFGSRGRAYNTFLYVGGICGRFGGTYSHLLRCRGVSHSTLRMKTSFRNFGTLIPHCRALHGRKQYF